MDAHRILIVEDEMIVARDLRVRLEKLGYTVTGTAATAADAVWKAAAGRPALVLMDIGLKGRADGIAAAAEIQKVTGAGIIFLSAYSDARSLQRAQELSNTAGFLGKPVDDGELERILASYFAVGQDDGVHKGTDSTPAA